MKKKQLEVAVDREIDIGFLFGTPYKVDMEDFKFSIFAITVILLLVGTFLLFFGLGTAITQISLEKKDWCEGNGGKQYFLRGCVFPLPPPH